MNLFIEQHGQGYPLVFFHGWGFNHQVWTDLIPHLCNQFTLYLVDLPGFGQTDFMDWHNFKRLMLLKLPKQFALLGWSMGGLYAMRFALEERRRVSHLIAVASSPYFVKEKNWPGLEPEILADFAVSLQKSPATTIKDFITRQADNYSLTLNTNFLGLEAGLASLVNWDFRHGLIGYNKPTCFVFGRLDTIVPIKTLMVMQGEYPQFEYHALKSAAHVPFLSHQMEFIQIIREFL